MSDEKRIRLGCLVCMRDDYCDPISQGELDALVESGWRDVHEFQIYEQAICSVSPGDLASVLDWETHIGTCPECAADEDQRMYMQRMQSDGLHDGSQWTDVAIKEATK